jgi:uncharacterized membrane protein YqaE (UPF0057 family)
MINMKNTKERFRADKEGNLDRTRDYNPNAINEYDKKTIEAVEKGGTFSKLLLASFDFLVNKTICLFNDLFVVLFKDGFNMFGKDDKEKLKEKNRRLEDRVRNGGLIIRYTFIRYLITILVPPLGIFMSKGLSGWVNILLSIAFMYISYPLGILYGVLLTYNSYYADLYHYTKEREIKTILKETEQEGLNDTRFIFVFLVMIMVGLMIFFGINKIKMTTISK